MQQGHNKKWPKPSRLKNSYHFSEPRLPPYNRKTRPLLAAVQILLLASRITTEARGGHIRWVPWDARPSLAPVLRGVGQPCVTNLHGTDQNGPDVTLGEVSHCPVATQKNHGAQGRTARSRRAAPPPQSREPRFRVQGHGWRSPACTGRVGRAAAPLSRGPMGNRLD